MRKLFSLLMLIQVLNVFFQEKSTISGYVEDISNNERLIGASIFVNNNTGVATNKYGFYSITLPKGNYQLSCTYVGYKTLSKQIHLDTDTVLNLLLQTGLEIEEIQVKANRVDGANKQLSSLSFFNPGMKELNRMPVVFGERDVLKTLQYQPGIK